MTTLGEHVDIPLDERLRRTVALWRTRHGVSARRFGVDALGDPGFVGTQARGRSVQLQTADRVLDWMAANASEEELRAVRERLADVPDPFDGKWDAAQATPEGTGGDPRKEANYLDTREAAAWLGLSPKTLERYRVSGEGPVFHRFGARVRYLLEDLEEWASARRWTSTTEERAARRRKTR